MWRHVDLFFGAMAGAGGGGARSARPRRSPSVAPSRAPGACRPVRSCTAPRTGWRSARSSWAVRSSSRPSTASTRSRCGDSSSASRRTIIVIVGDAFAVRCSTRSNSPEGRALDVSCLHVVLSGGAILSPSLKRAFVDRLPAVLVVDGYGASETGGQGQSVVVAGGDVPSAPRFRVGDDTQVLGADLRPVGPASSAGSRAAATSRSATTRTRPSRPRPFPSSTACAGRCPAITRSSRTTVSITLLGRGSVSINTGGEKVYPEEVESVLKAPRRRVRRGRRRACPDERWGERVVAIVQSREGATHADARRAAAPQPRTPRRLQGPASVVLVDTIERSPSGKPDYRWARAVATRTPGTVEA